VSHQHNSDQIVRMCQNDVRGATGCGSPVAPMGWLQAAAIVDQAPWIDWTHPEQRDALRTQAASNLGIQ
jgi:hypothetical protein